MRDSGGGKENRQETELRGEEQVALPAQEAQWKPETSPGLGGHQATTEPTGPDVQQGPEEVEYKQQRMEEGEERDRAPREERAPEQGTDRDVARPPLEEIQDKFNSTGRGWGITFGGITFGPTGPPDPATKGSSQRRGRSLSTGLTAHAQVGGRPTPQGITSGASGGLSAGAVRLPGPEGTAARRQHQYPRERGRGAGSESHLTSPEGEVSGEGHVLSSHTPGRPLSALGQGRSYLELGRKEETK